MNKKIDQLYTEYAADVYRFAYGLSGSAMEADDLTAETFVRAWVANAPIRTETVKAYLFTIARNLFLKELKKQQRLIELDERVVANHPSPEWIVIERSRLAETIQQLQTLPEIDRAALLLHAHHQLPYAEIARILNISLSAAKVKVYRARLKLAQQNESNL